MCRTYLYLLATDKKTGLIPDIIKCFLFILSLIYGMIVKFLSFVSQINPYRLNCKVISVGNVTLGGTGKTPLVELLVRLLADRGYKVVVLSRGYKRRTADIVCSCNKSSVSNNAQINCEMMGDEPYMLSRNLNGIPVIVHRDRIKAAESAVDNYAADTVILDDGFQQWRIKKDLDIITIDVTNPLGNLHLIPRGILREPLSSLKRAQIFVLTKVNLNPDNQSIKRFLKTMNPGALITEAIYRPVGFYKIGSSKANLLKSDRLFGQEVSLVCGIADPKSFEVLINKLGIKIGLSFIFPDHHLYTKEDLDKIISDSKQKGISNIITTEKDSVRLSFINYKLLNIDCYVLRVELELLQYETFRNRILSLY